MRHSLSIRIHYPLSRVEPAGEEPRLVLRTERDWDLDVEPTAVAADLTRFDFDLDLGAPFL